MPDPTRPPFGIAASNEYSRREREQFEPTLPKWMTPERRKLLELDNHTVRLADEFGEALATLPGLVIVEAFEQGCNEREQRHAPSADNDLALATAMVMWISHCATILRHVSIWQSPAETVATVPQNAIEEHQTEGMLRAYSNAAQILAALVELMIISQ
jgi:hypothetical protein